jgi:hypothetical protein
VVTLVGDVDDAAARDRAIEIARGVPGVASVESRIAVRGAPVTAPPPPPEPAAPVE